MLPKGNSEPTVIYFPYLHQLLYEYSDGVWSTFIDGEKGKNGYSNSIHIYYRTLGRIFHISILIFNALIIKITRSFFMFKPEITPKCHQ